LTVFQGEANGVYVSQSVIKYVKYDGWYKQRIMSRITSNDDVSKQFTTSQIIYRYSILHYVYAW
jgi:hypothetical protein